MCQERRFSRAPGTQSCSSIHTLALSWMNRLGLARVFQSVPVYLPQPELALQVFQLVSCEQVLPIKVVWNVHPGAWTYNSHRIPPATAAHTGGTQRSLCFRALSVLAACEPGSISLIVFSTGCFQSPGTSPDFHDFKYPGEWLGNSTSHFLRALGHISPDSGTFRFFRCSRP